ARRDPERALDLGNVELAAATRLDLKRIMVRASELRARALVDLDRRDEARAASADALALAERIGYPAGRWRALALTAEIAPGADAADARARACLEEVGATLPEDLRRTLYATTRLGHDARP